jgi:hypothetical protein
MDRFPGPQKSGDQMHAVIAGVAGYDAVVIGRETLRFRERLMSARGAAIEVGVLWKAAIVVANNELRGVGHHVHGPIGPIINFFRMANAERQITALVSGVGSGGSVTLIQCLRHGAIAHRA